ncbi:MAG: gliding motility-associated C-terminal domain-containing protein [Bacteroidales bacterium]|nr:gliding motility-associated C-terminal domain-containing protein [Bacteroidales bacterium]
MKRTLIFLILPWLCLFQPTVAQTLFFGDCYPAGMAAARTTADDGLTAGIRQTQMLRRPQFPATVQVEDSSYTLPTRLDARYAAFAFDSITATRDGYYLYRYRALNDSKRVLTDSVYVQLKRNARPPSEPDIEQAPVPLPMPVIVNLVVIDHHGFHCFKVLNAEYFTRIDLTLYDRYGAVLYRTDDYRNDYDMSPLPADTYYYRLTAYTPQGSISRKGFVELVKPQ